MRRVILFCIVGLICALSLPPTLTAQERVAEAPEAPSESADPEPESSVTTHQVTIGGESVSYV